LGKQKPPNPMPGCRKEETDTRIEPDSLCHSSHVSSRRFAQISNGIDERDLHGQEGVGGVLDQFRAVCISHQKWNIFALAAISVYWTAKVAVENRLVNFAHLLRCFL
jgi:hypothetical protein